MKFNFVKPVYNEVTRIKLAHRLGNRYITKLIKNLTQKRSLDYTYLLRSGKIQPYQNLISKKRLDLDRADVNEIRQGFKTGNKIVKETKKR